MRRASRLRGTCPSEPAPGSPSSTRPRSVVPAAGIEGGTAPRITSSAGECGSGWQTASRSKSVRLNPSSRGSASSARLPVSLWSCQRQLSGARKPRSRLERRSQRYSIGMDGKTPPTTSVVWTSRKPSRTNHAECYRETRADAACAGSRQREVAEARRRNSQSSRIEVGLQAPKLLKRWPRRKFQHRRWNPQSRSEDRRAEKAAAPGQGRTEAERCEVPVVAAKQRPQWPPRLPIHACSPKSAPEAGRKEVGNEREA